MKRTGNSLRDLWDNIKCTNIQITGVPEEEEKKKGYEKIFEEIIVENFPNMEKEIVQSSPRDAKSPIQDKLKEIHAKTHTNQTQRLLTQRLLKTAKEKQQVTYKGNPICLTADLSIETLQARRKWEDIFKVLKGKNLQPKLLYPARISFRIDGDIKSFSDKQKLREFSTTKPALQQMLKELMQSRNTREEKRSTKINPKQLRTWQQEDIYQ